MVGGVLGPGPLLPRPMEAIASTKTSAVWLVEFSVQCYQVFEADLT